MAFPIEEKYIVETEKLLNFKFPSDYRKSMQIMNGGEVEIDENYYFLFPIFDKSDPKRIKRTCNSVHSETEKARKDYGFPVESVAIGHDECGHYLGFLPNDSAVYFFYASGEIEKIADTFSDLSRELDHSSAHRE